MRKLLFVVLAIAAIQNWDRLTAGFQSSPKAVSNDTHQVILYGTQWCGYCAKVRTLFKSKGIEYHEYDIENSLEGRRQYDALGGSGVPLIIINETRIKGYSERQILAALRNQQLL